MVSIPQAVSTVATLHIHVSVEEVEFSYVSIPQAVSTVATDSECMFIWIFYNVSIPQAVSTVATQVNGILCGIKSVVVSIPQAVSTVATEKVESEVVVYHVSIPQAVSTVATLLNRVRKQKPLLSFNTASGKYCCNSGS